MPDATCHRRGPARASGYASRLGASAFVVALPQSLPAARWAVPGSCEFYGSGEPRPTSVAQYVMRQRVQHFGLEDLHVAAVDLEHALVLQATQHAAHGFWRQPKVVGDVGAGHGQAHAVRGEAALG